MIAAIVVAAGSSRRMGFDKLFADLNGAPVLARSLAAFRCHPEIAQVIVVTGAEHRERVAALGLAHQVVTGGAFRHLSVQAGLDAVAPGTTLVAVHDGARPLIDASAISACLAEARKHGAAACARRITETVKRADESGRVIGAVDREGLWAMETPQCFALDLLRRAYQVVLDSDRIVTDEVSAVEALGETVHLVENRFPNLKITFPPDLEVARALLPGSP
ncbi:MAG: 2-C-methyl-D-erythritol 4-phosphate cytidylyltransferase [Verrucomicrobia bacterium]|nr:2-C-methyl-D-erythritol 4-phosphate cytidylyltransferase [Verrucomicrobiota bacterium]